MNVTSIAHDEADRVVGHPDDEARSVAEDAAAQTLNRIKDRGYPASRVDRCLRYDVKRRLRQWIARTARRGTNQTEGFWVNQVARPGYSEVARSALEGVPEADLPVAEQILAGVSGTTIVRALPGDTHTSRARIRRIKSQLAEGLT